MKLVTFPARLESSDEIGYEIGDIPCEIKNSQEI